MACDHGIVEGRYEIRNGLPEHFLSRVIASGGNAGPFQRLERGELVLKEFYGHFESVCLQRGHKINARELFTDITSIGAEPVMVGRFYIRRRQ